MPRLNVYHNSTDSGWRGTVELSTVMMHKLVGETRTRQARLEDQRFKLPRLARRGMEKSNGSPRFSRRWSPKVWGRDVQLRYQLGR
jgi:hypothetical protein